MAGSARMEALSWATDCLRLSAIKCALYVRLSVRSSDQYHGCLHVGQGRLSPYKLAPDIALYQCCDPVQKHTAACACTQRLACPFHRY